MQKNNIILIIALLSIATLSQAFLSKNFKRQDLEFVADKEDVWGVSEERFANMKEAIEKATSDSLKITLLRVITSDFAFKAGQISELVETLSTENVREENLDLFKNRCLNPKDAEDYKCIISDWDKCEIVEVASDNITLPSKVWKEDDIEELIKKIEDEDNIADRVNITMKEFEDSEKQITTESLITIIEAIKGKNVSRALSHLCDGKSSIKRSDIEQLLDSYEGEMGISQLLDDIKFKIVDPFNKYTLIDSFTFSEVIEKVSETLNEIKPTDSIFGDVKSLDGVKNIVFVIDISESMETTFESSSGKKVSRIQAIRDELSRTLKTLTKDHMFTIIAYDTYVKYWQNDLVEATKENISDGIEYAKRLAVGGATNINSALSSAFKIKDVDYIYFLTDGVPTRGETNIDTILDNVKGWYKDTEAPIKAIAFLEGYFEYDDKPGSRKLMSKLAEITHGDYIDSSASKKVEDDE